MEQTRDHRYKDKTSFQQPAGPVKPPPAVQPHHAGPPVTTIDPGKWYHIKHAGTEKYMMISGHKNPTKSLAVLTIEEMQPDNTSQQWRFVMADENNGSVYKLQNRKYTGDLCATIISLYLDFKRRDHLNDCSFMMVLNPDKSWYILTRRSNNKRALSTEIANERHCFPYEMDPLIGGRVLYDFECAETVRSEFVTNRYSFTGDNSQKWILEAVAER